MTPIHTDNGPDDRQQHEPHFQVHLPAYLCDAIFPDRQLALESLHHFTEEHGFHLSIRTTVRSVAYLWCRRGRCTNAQPQATSDTSQGYTSYTKCPYSVKVAPFTKADNQVGFVVREVNAMHNHAQYPEGMHQQVASRTSSRLAKRARFQETHEDQTCMARQQEAVSSSIEVVTGKSHEAHQPQQPSESQPLGQTVEDAGAADDDNDQDTTDIVASSVVAATANAAANSTVNVAGAPSSSVISTRTDSSAIRGLLSLSFQQDRRRQTPATSQHRKAPTIHTPSAPKALPSPTSSLSLESSSTEHKHPLHTILLDPPYDVTMGQVSLLNATQVQGAIAWARMLLSALELRAGFHQCNQAGQKDAG